MEITESALACFLDIESFKVNVLGADAAANFVEQLLVETVSAIETEPLLYRISAELADYGLRVHERIDRHGYRTLYEVDGSVARLLLVLHTKQDIQSALYRHLIIRSGAFGLSSRMGFYFAR